MREMLITGATGFIGVELVQQLSACGYVPRVLVRRPHRAALLSTAEVTPYQGDLLSPRSLARAVDGVDTVFHLGGRASFESYDRLRPTIVDATETLGQLAADAGVRHFVFASSLFVHGETDGLIDAETPTRPRLGYGRAKLEAEDRLLSIARTSEMTVACVRLPHVYGSQSILFEQARSGVAIFPGAMSNRCGQLHVDDAARLLTAVGDRRWSGRSAVADQTTVTWSDFFEVLRSLDPSLRLIRPPRWLGIAGGSVLETIFSRSGRPTLYTKDTVVGFNLDLPVAPQLIWPELDLAPRYPSVYEGIPAVLDGYVRYRWRHPIADRRS